MSDKAVVRDDSMYTLPPSNHSRAQEIRALLSREPTLDNGVISQELVKFGHKLLELSEH